MGIQNTNRYFKQALLSEIGEEGQKKLSASTAVVAGCGGLGTVIANGIVRAGVGTVRIVDRDFIELDNLARQILFDEEDICRGLPKAIAAAEKLRLINSTVSIEPVVSDMVPENIESIIRGADIVIDGTDNFETRFLINDACVKRNIPWIYGGVIATCGMSYTIIPGRTPCFQCLQEEMPGPGKSPTCDTVGVLGTAVSVIAAIQVTESLKVLMGNRDVLLGKLVYVDVWNGQWELLDIKKGEKPCPVCDEGIFVHLEKNYGIRTTTLCGQNAIQISSPLTNAIPLPELALRLRACGEVRYNEYMLRFNAEACEFTVFPDGRINHQGDQRRIPGKDLAVEIYRDMNISKIRGDFPFLHQTHAGRPVVYFDNAATTQKPI